MQKKIAWFLFIALVIVFGILFYRNYQATEFPYIYNIPAGYFDDVGRKVANNNNYDAFVDFMSGNYSNHLRSLNISSSEQFKDINKKISDFVSQGDGTGLNRLLESEKEYLGKIQQKYHLLFSTGNVFYSGEWGDLDPTKVDAEQILRFPQDGTRFLQELLLVTYFDCKINPSNLCQKNQKELKSLLNLTQRRGPTAFALINTIYLKQILQFNSLTELIPKKQISNYCLDYQNIDQLYKDILIDEYNTYGIVLLRAESQSKNNTMIDEIGKNKLQQIYWSAINETSYSHQDLVSIISYHSPRAKSILVKLGFKKNHYQADIITNEIAGSINGAGGFKKKLQEIQTLCKPYLSQ